ncbi:2-amino-4-hydroxy-6-hydroxymethyldihydropteridine diphosphokinase [Nitratireductor kimnyeongensis]|nr:2-amino-4-hydroxy-6-hydroxymethyldihydropteridine diphosphokinase [Nitratireductor kimnyeongensis]
MQDVYLGLGGNVGDPRQAMQLVLSTLDARDDTEVHSVSSLYRTPPWGKLDQPDFLNAVAWVRTNLAPYPLLEQCLTIERALKRVRQERWGPRPIDVDILFYGDFVVDDAGLTIPHPRMAERAFVLAPLAEIAPAREIGGKSIEALVGTLDQSGMQRITPDGAWWHVGEDNN